MRLRLSAGLVLLCAMALIASLLHADDATRSTAPTDGLHQNDPTLFAFTNARIVQSPGHVIERGTLVIRDGVIVDVGADVTVPVGARIIDCTDRTIYPGFIDSYSEMPADASTLDSKSGAPYWNAQVQPQFRVSRAWKRDDDASKKLRSQGIVAQYVAPSVGLIKGTGAIVSTGTTSADKAILKEDVAEHLAVQLKNAKDNEYPDSPMGAYALVRQAFYDSEWYTAAKAGLALDPTLPPIEQNDALAALSDRRDKLMVIDGPDELYDLRAQRIAEEFKLKYVLHGGGFEYRVVGEIAKAHVPVIVTLNFPKPPDVSSPALARSVTLEALMHWDLAPEEPARLVKAGVPILFSTDGLKDTGKFLEQARVTVDRGLDEDAALAAMTTTPAQTLGISDRLGSIERGKLASFVITDGDLFDRDTHLLETWVNGERFTYSYRADADPRGKWKIDFDAKHSFTLNLSGELTSPDMKLIPATQPTTLPTTNPTTAASSVKMSNVSVVETQMTFVVDGKSMGVEGLVLVSLALGAEPSGYVVLPDGTRRPLELVRETQSTSTQTTSKPATHPTSRPTTRASFEPDFPLGAYGRGATTGPTTWFTAVENVRCHKGLPEQPAKVAILDAKVWTCGPQGVIDHANVYVSYGTIEAIVRPDDPRNRELMQVPLIVDADNYDLVVIHANGLHLTPGIIDCHSHMATDGGINESGQAVTAEVRIGDFIDSTDITILRQLGGGVTSSNILHGSANPIGGQNQVIKLRWGGLPEELKFDGAPPGIKFALGENVKQSNWGDNYTSRYPQTRMGVEQIIRDEFQAAKDYQRKWALWNLSKRVGGVPPRRDLELDAIVEILEGKRLVHCHSYRQDEILALIRTADELGFKVRTFQHGLECYKVASEIKAHGAGVSTFSDWWAYKFEVIDAIPFNGAILHDQGIVVSFNSDDRELARRLNLEAAKAVKYGGVSPEEALKFVTINPAIQLGIDSRVGSIEVGKDADFVLWSGDPLSTSSKAMQTWIDGRKYFDRAEYDEEVKRVQSMRQTLIQKILKGDEAPAKTGETKKTQRELWPREDEFDEMATEAQRHREKEEAK